MAREGVDVFLAGRSLEKLDAVHQEISDCGGKSKRAELDLKGSSSIARFSDELHEQIAQLDVLVHCAGLFDRGRIAESSISTLDKLYETNVRGVCDLTKSLLPLLKNASGDIVFINSSIVNSNAPDAGHYAATKHALLGFANALRAEVNEDGVRVLTVYPGRTATPGQEAIFEAEGRDYRPDLLLQPSDIAEMLIACLNLPDTAEVVDLHIRPHRKW